MVACKTDFIFGHVQTITKQDLFLGKTAKKQQLS